MRTLIILLAFLVLAATVTRQENHLAASRGNPREGCISCHMARGGLGSAAHDAVTMGCSSCHLGNPHAFEADRAHQGMVVNPGDLRVAAQTCGQRQCHPAMVPAVKHSVMATASGILGALDSLWGIDHGPRNAALLWDQAPTVRTAPEQYFAKLCAACHLWWPKGRGRGEQTARGGGCSACHVVSSPGKAFLLAGEFDHCALSMQVPLDNCVRCHNRSARVGLTYQGQWEANGYGTPHTQGTLNARRLSGGRFFQSIPPDAHFQAGMVCIDCHTGTELMGGGLAHRRLRDQLDVACQDCHAPRFSSGRDALAEAARMAKLNPAVPTFEARAVATTSRGATPLYALQLSTRPGDGPSRQPQNPQALLFRKLDGKPLLLSLPANPAEHHALPGHERLTCQACHSRFMPRCYGCHVQLDPTGRQYDALADEHTSGKWQESASHTRFEDPPLAVDATGRLAPYSPCEVRVDLCPEQGRTPMAPARNAIAFFDPHSTVPPARTCQDCHLALLGPSLEALGNPAWQAFPDGGRKLNADERRAAAEVTPCLPCHARYDDAVFKDFAASRKRLAVGAATACTAPRTAISVARKGQ
ncbi:multiheme c-type cytochrome [Desulfovibrio ferrophilus]|uniref:Cytochrome c family protein n=1 Tax=Desulfovibrio ferrophilus TaxID=241368 RepID=A0A2Z6AZA8_9BACT|nr:multiheme c-type cytochrome [Desulfovibrio ferrophilus]BBD08486.1 uncharacterized protein DFE_1760 [Desulfovibrio ferrophilus]